MEHKDLLAAGDQGEAQDHPVHQELREAMEPLDHKVAGGTLAVLELRERGVCKELGDLAAMGATIFLNGDVCGMQ